ncbi:hypothetical protein TPHA_0O01830 [Tetrapisispora phaffii CBS 4417]|uniref:DNA-binding protein RAP1 n=1 Tax=Tetrapisispora phaffii (strain ATCC 24235 / CBS 4417 / NBRC 1672 / NRRL Y-8282 / UCD 70-5) TaxID=1071381 RepID=G8C1X2_TETPH|nr:hypothetical protein TPHA_0O01830 [Tetrapisispora phaffii CBS 4417]CCE66150.1 hypothetical protein TPHA_0O01830 [Tetrapisispora phaffii CBS 4417]
MSSVNDFDTAPDEYVDAKESSHNDKRHQKAELSEDQLNSKAPNENHSLFKGYSFFINTKPDAYGKKSDINSLTRLALSHEGTILDELPDSTSMTGEQRSKFYVVSPYNSTNLNTVTATYIKACCQNNTLLEAHDYLVPYDDFKKGEQNTNANEAEAKNDKNDKTDSIDSELVGNIQLQSMTAENTTPLQLNNSKEKNKKNRRSQKNKSPTVSYNKASFTEEEDEFILDVVKKNPTRRTTHTLFDEISNYLPNHTGNSVRHRYRVYLSKRLEFVYQVDSNGRLVRDENGDLIKTKVLPPSLKKKFTAQEDYTLAIAIKKQFYKDLYQVDPDSGSSLIMADDSPVMVAKRKVTMAPNHVPGTEPSFDSFKVLDRTGPLAREFFKSFSEKNTSHTENAWRDRFRKFILPYGIDAYIEYYDSEKAKGKEPEPMRNFTNRAVRVGPPTPGNYNSVNKRAKLNINEVRNAAAAAAAAASAHVGYTIPENELLDETTMKFISTIKNDIESQQNQQNFEYPQDIAEAIRQDFANEENQYDNLEIDVMEFPPAIASVDLFLPEFFRMGSVKVFVDKIQEIISRDYEPSQAEKLVQDLCDEVGVRKTFSTSVLTALSGDLMIFPRYFLHMFKENANPPTNVPGIWTPEDDIMLKNNKPQEIDILIQKHGKGRIEMRKRFVERDLI